MVNRPPAYARRAETNPGPGLCPNLTSIHTAGGQIVTSSKEKKAGGKRAPAGKKAPAKKSPMHPEVLLRAVLGESNDLTPVPVGFTPLGFNLEVSGIDPKEIPKTMDELGELLSYTYDLTVKRAAELNIPVVGSVSGGFDRRVIIFEWTRYKTLTEARVQYRYGYVIRFCLTINKWDVKGKLSLPFLSAQAELGNLEASWLMQVRGLTGPKIDAVVLPPQDLKVETFIIAKQSLEAAIKAVADASTKFVPGMLLSTIDPTSDEVKYKLSAVRAFAIYSVSKGRTGSAATARLSSTDPTVSDTITEVYNYFGLADPTATPTNQMRDSASRMLIGIKADV